MKCDSSSRLDQSLMIYIYIYIYNICNVPCFSTERKVLDVKRILVGNQQMI